MRLNDNRIFWVGIACGIAGILLSLAALAGVIFWH